MSHVLRKPVFGVSDQIRHKPGCTTTEDGWRIEIPDLGSRGIVLSAFGLGVRVDVNEELNFFVKIQKKNVGGVRSGGGGVGLGWSGWM